IARTCSACGAGLWPWCLELMRDIFRLLTYILRLAQNVRLARTKIVLIAIAGTVSGISSTIMMALITESLTRKGADPVKLSWIFLRCTITLPGFRFLSQKLLIDLTQRSLVNLRLRLSRSILAAPLRHLERVGPHRLVATLTTDIATIVESLGMIPLLLM